jgi:hypothetical protein
MSRQQRQGLHMAWPHHREMTPIQGRNLGQANRRSKRAATGGRPIAAFRVTPSGLSPGSQRGDRLTRWMLRGYDSRFSSPAGPTAVGRTVGLSSCHAQTAADERPRGLLGQGLPVVGVVRLGLEQSESPRAGAGEDLGGLRRAPAVARRLPGPARVPAPCGSAVGGGNLPDPMPSPPPDPHIAARCSAMSARYRDRQRILGGDVIQGRRRTRSHQEDTSPVAWQRRIVPAISPGGR